uniref:Uncharacterized protein n=1 Tax=Vibrio ziniensis TaxID=2711221 RepID=A0A6G7CQ39_9VIBR|nr:DUF3693 domain-containing protein [Vibrio ziniensis]QIH44225.1 hypothetical protein G5S32_19935 [Vibrio ziniensis]
MRKGTRYISDSEAVFLAENAGIDPEMALLGCHADRNENPQIKLYWQNIAKKYNGLGLTTISMACGAVAASLEPIRQYALYWIMTNNRYLTITYHMLYLYTNSPRLSRNA